jgi:hypothetical protein
MRTVSVIIDGTPNMSGIEAGFVAFFTNTLVLPLYLKEFVCAVCGLSHMEVVMRTRIEVVHLIASRVLDENN